MKQKPQIQFKTFGIAIISLVVLLGVANLAAKQTSDSLAFNEVQVPFLRTDSAQIVLPVNPADSSDTTECAEESDSGTIVLEDENNINIDPLYLPEIIPPGLQGPDDEDEIPWGSIPIPNVDDLEGSFSWLPWYLHNNPLPKGDMIITDPLGNIVIDGPATDNPNLPEIPILPMPLPGSGGEPPDDMQLPAFGDIGDKNNEEQKIEESWGGKAFEWLKDLFGIDTQPTLPVEDLNNKDAFDWMEKMSKEMRNREAERSSEAPLDPVTEHANNIFEAFDRYMEANQNWTKNPTPENTEKINETFREWYDSFGSPAPFPGTGNKDPIFPPSEEPPVVLEPEPDPIDQEEILEDEEDEESPDSEDQESEDLENEEEIIEDEEKGGIILFFKRIFRLGFENFRNLFGF